MQPKEMEIKRGLSYSSPPKTKEMKAPVVLMPPRCCAA